MTKLPVRVTLFASGLAGLLSSPAKADFTAANWQFRRQIQIEGSAPTVTVRIDSIIYRGSAARLADLRVISKDLERPYVLETLRGSANETELQPRIIDKSVVPGAGLQMTLDLGAPSAHNRLRLTTPDRGSGYRNFQQRVRIETSDDKTHWASAREDSYIFDFSQDGRRVSVLSIDYPVSTRRYVRATIFGWSDPKFVQGALLTHWIERPDTRETYVVLNHPAAIQDLRTQTSVYSIDLGFQGLPHDQIELTVAPALFYRAVEIETSKDNQEWTHAGGGVIYRTREQQCLAATFSESWDRYLRFRIMNRDDQPLAVTKLAIGTIVRQIKLQTDQGGQPWLLYGNADARTPAYDLSFVLPANAAVNTTAALGPPQANPGYRPKPALIKPWSDRHPGILYGVLALAIAGMAFVTIRFIRKILMDGVV